VLRAGVRIDQPLRATPRDRLGLRRGRRQRHQPGHRDVAALVAEACLIHRAGDKLFGTFRVTGIDHAGNKFDRYGIDLYEVRDGKIALKDSYLKAE
jgi:ketosteroid isomerase-like protein